VSFPESNSSEDAILVSKKNHGHPPTFAAKTASRSPN
jgi:hypothetical protein